MHGQVKATTGQALDHYLGKFVEAVDQVRRARGSEPMRQARNKKAEAETELVKAYQNHHRER